MIIINAILISMILWSIHLIFKSFLIILSFLYSACKFFGTCIWSCKLIIKNGLKPVGTNCLSWCDLIIQMTAWLLSKPPRCQWEVHTCLMSWIVFNLPLQHLWIAWVCPPALLHLLEESCSLLWRGKKYHSVLLSKE